MKQKHKVLLMTFDIRENYPPLALGYLKAYAEKFSEIKENYEIKIKNFLLDKSLKKDSVLNYILYENPSIIAFSCYMWNIEFTLDLVKLLKDITPKVKIILGGPEVHLDYLKENLGVDIIINGEGEKTFYELLRSFIKRSSLQEVRGISFRDENKKIIENSPMPLIENLDEIPSPYLNEIFNLDSLNVSIVECYRGCIFKCAYCYEGKTIQKIRYFSISRIISEASYLIKKDVKNIWLAASILNLNKKWLIELCLRLRDINPEKKATFHVHIRGDFLDEEILNTMINANIVNIEIGVQSIHPETLENINRPIDFKKIKENFNLFKKYKDFNAILELIFGLPGDNFLKFSKSIIEILHLNPNRITVFHLSILPNTPILKETEKYKIKFQDKPPYYVLSNYSFSFKEIQKAKIMSESILDEYKLRIPDFFKQT